MAFVALTSGLIFMYLRNRKIYREYSVLKEQNEAELELDRIGPSIHARTHTHARKHARGTRTHTCAPHTHARIPKVCVCVVNVRNSQGQKGHTDMSVCPFMSVCRMFVESVSCRCRARGRQGGEGGRAERKRKIERKRQRQKEKDREKREGGRQAGREGGREGGGGRERERERERVERERERER